MLGYDDNGKKSMIIVAIIIVIILVLSFIFGILILIFATNCEIFDKNEKDYISEINAFLAE